MPLNTQITRDGEKLSLRWGSFHIAAMVLAATMDSGKGPFDGECSRMRFYGTDNPEEALEINHRTSFMCVDYSAIGATPLNDGPYTLKEPYTFVDSSDHEVLTLQAGDVLHAWRSVR